MTNLQQALQGIQSRQSTLNNYRQQYSNRQVGGLARVIAGIRGGLAQDSINADREALQPQIDLHNSAMKQALAGQLGLDENIAQTLPNSELQKVLLGRLQNPQNSFMKDAGGFIRDINTGERAFPDARNIQQETAQARLKLDKQKFGLDIERFGLEADKFAIEAEEIAKKTASGGIGEEELFKRSEKLRGEFVKGSGDFTKIQDAFKKIQVSASNPGPAADISLVISYMNMLDPDSVVREGEFATAENAAGVSSKIRNIYNKAIRGQRLTDRQRQDFLGISQRIFDSASQAHQQRVQTFTGLANQFGVDPSTVTIDLASPQIAAQLIPAEDLKAKYGLE